MKSLHKLIVGAALIGGSATLIYAGPDDGSSADVSITTPTSKTAMLSPAEMTVSANELMNSMSGMLRHVAQLREKASKEKDIIKLNCVNDKLMPMKAQVNLAESARVQLDQSIGANDDAGRYAAYADVTISNDKVKDLRDQADACVGDALSYIGVTDVQVTGPDHPLLPGEGPTEGIEPPTYRSPFD